MHINFQFCSFRTTIGGGPICYGVRCYITVPFFQQRKREGELVKKDRENLI